MEWTDEGIVVAAVRHGESSAIVDLLTAGHGRHKGLVRGGMGKRLRGVLQPGNQVTATWRARLSEHLGHFTIEPGAARAAGFLDDGVRLAGLTALCAVAATALPEREPHTPIYEGFLAVLDALEAEDGAAGGHAWVSVLVRWEVGLLQELGFRLDLESCAATGVSDDLIYVSPRSGRAVSRAGGEDYKDKLLALPAYLTAAPGTGNGHLGVADLRAGLRLTGHFLEKHLYHPHDRALPPARGRLLDKLAR